MALSASVIQDWFAGTARSYTVPVLVGAAHGREQGRLGGSGMTRGRSPHLEATLLDHLAVYARGFGAHAFGGEELLEAHGSVSAELLGLKRVVP